MFKLLIVAVALVVVAQGASLEREKRQDNPTVTNVSIFYDGRKENSFLFVFRAIHLRWEKTAATSTFLAAPGSRFAAARTSCVLLALFALSLKSLRKCNETCAIIKFDAINSRKF
jgi:hypothetical protein